MLRVEDVTVRFEGKDALAGVSVEIESGEVVAILGPSGSGKTTFLRVVAGLQRPDAGRVLLAGSDLAPVPPHRRGIGYVFQDHALFQHRDVAGNVAFGLRMRNEPKRAIEQRVGELLDLVGLGGFETRSVATLSGGEQQRVALARALAPEPRVLLLDEPLGSLDRRLRERLFEDIGGIFEQVGVTAVYVTHDQTEAFALGDRVGVMRDGRIVQVGSPDSVWSHPLDADVARFLGYRNVRQDRVVRPEAVHVTPADGSRGNAVVEDVVRLGATVRLRVRLDTGEVLDAVVTSLEHPRAGERVLVSVDEAGVIELE
jgi:thiamine transport system ATP-binding protein